MKCFNVKTNEIEDVDDPDEEIHIIMWTLDSMERERIDEKMGHHYIGHNKDIMRVRGIKYEPKETD